MCYEDINTSIVRIDMNSRIVAMRLSLEPNDFYIADIPCYTYPDE